MTKLKKIPPQTDWYTRLWVTRYLYGDNGVVGQYLRSAHDKSQRPKPRHKPHKRRERRGQSKPR